jgi:hypothetical protein
MTSFRGPGYRKNDGPRRITKLATRVNAQGAFSPTFPKLFDKTAESRSGGSFRDDVGWRVVSGVRKEWVWWYIVSMVSSSISVLWVISVWENEARTVAA